MMKHQITLLAVLLIPFFANAQNREADSLSLVSIYQSLDGDNWPSNDNWLSDMPLEEWKGIGIHNNRVNKLEIKSTSSADISGSFPIQVLNLSELTTLEIRQIAFNEPIPASLLQLTKLNRIVFESCNLIGELPQIFDQFSNLKTLILTFNELTGPLPALPQNMNLVYIDRNQFSGPLPISWTGNEMVNLQINGNNLTGNYDILNSMPKLNSMNLSDNTWDDHTLPLWIDDIPNLDRFTCDGCSIIGEIPSELDFSEQEYYSGMFLSNNELSGDISILFNNPEYGKKMYLRARSNNFSGELPVHKIVSFHQLDVYDNHYSSMTLPQEGVEYSLDILYNDFTYEGLSPVQEYIALDSIIGVKYRNQNATGNSDTLIITTQTSISLSAGDGHPNTTYQWYRVNQEIEGETEEELVLDITENNQSGWYRCHMENKDYPELDLRSNMVNLEVDISTKTDNILIDNLTISPNPVNDYLGVNSNGNNNFQYAIKSISGRTIITGQSDNKIDVSQINAGVYFLSIFIDDSIVNQKFIKL